MKKIKLRIVTSHHDSLVPVYWRQNEKVIELARENGGQIFDSIRKTGRKVEGNSLKNASGALLLYMGKLKKRERGIGRRDAESDMIFLLLLIVSDKIRFDPAFLDNLPYSFLFKIV